MLLFDYIVTLGLDGLKKFIGEKYDKHQMNKAIRAYIEAQRNITFNSNSEDEIDFGGLIDYLCKHFHNDIELRLTGETSKERGQAHKHIVDEAVSYARAHTSTQEKFVKKIVNDMLNILRDFYEKKLTHEQKYLAARIVDDVSRNNANLHEEHTAIILRAIQEANPLSHDQIKRWASESKFDLLGEQLSDITETVSAHHELKPYYGFQPKTINGKQQFVSVPLTDEARKLYPPHFKCKGKAYIDDREIGDVTPDTINYANNHQLTIRLVVEDATKYLGTHVDQQQCEVKEIIGAEFQLYPKPFPEAMPYSIIIDDITYYNYILLRVKERFEDGTVIITNESQEIPFKIILQLNPITCKNTFTFSINGGSNLDHLKYSRFLKAAHSNGRLKIHHLEYDINLVEAHGAEAVSVEYIDKLESEIAFLESVVAIERFFNIKIDIPGQFTPKDVDLIHHIAAIILGKEIKGKWIKFKARMIVESHTKENLTAWMEKPYDFTYVGTATTNIFGRSLTYPLMRTFHSIKLANPNKISKLLEVCEVGDDIPMEFIPGEKDGVGEYVDRLGKTTNDDQTN